MLAFRIVGICPFESPDDRLVVALAKGGALAVLDLGHDAEAARKALASVARQVREPFAVRPSAEISLTTAELPAAARFIVLPAGVDPKPWAGRELIVQVRSVDEAEAALAAGAVALIAKGAESGGAVGETSTFVLLQALLSSGIVPASVPVWAQGGIGPHTAAAALAGGAAGVVLEDQLALLREARTPAALRTILQGLDGSETVVLSGHRVFTRPGMLAATLVQPSEDEVRARLGGLDPNERLVPLGQAIGQAAKLADRYRTVAGLLRAVEEAMDEGPRLARALRPLGPDSPLAQRFGCRYPIVQGPMSRVSDTAPFAQAVAQAGALPFLAVGLSSGEALSKLIGETKALLGEAPWGLGLLGFAPRELWDEQLALALAARPAAAIVAGGRPSQTRALEEAGVAAWLHVPSPGLLDMYLADGARRFVFEGRECGGHVGPRSSFALWEAQLERLMRFEAPDELEILFAGGIHDARSAAMVAAMAAPLAQRGVRIGVLLGTAYLFTEEVVASGAIGEAFQQAALRCETTRVLQSAPGHESRCALSPYVDSFEAERAQLEAAGRPAQEIWEALEAFNIGRLAVAAKGIRLDANGALVRCDEEEQRREGMFMLGQLAALRGEVSTMARLHEDVAEGSQALLEALPVAGELSCAPGSADIAIVGMSAAYAGATDLASFWANILDGVDAVTEVPPERWSTEIYFDPEPRGENKTYSKWGGFLPHIPFDPLAYGIPPRSLVAIEPVQLLALEMARRALEDAGYGDDELGRWFDRERTAVIFGAEAGTELAGAYGFRTTYQQLIGPVPKELDAALPRLTEDSFPGVLANVIAGRIANRLDLGGTNFTIDAACGSSLAALHVSVRELLAGACDMVLCGGADVHNSINDYVLFSSVHALSHVGPARTFDAGADGTTIGEGVGVVVIKRLADAQRDGDRIYAVIRGVGAASDGKSMGLTAPRPEGQQRAIEAALRQAGVRLSAVGLVEAHGTGTVVGDRTELEVLERMFAADGAAPASCALGSVKSQIGHSKCAAGVAGLIKASLAIHHGVHPPTLHIDKPNPGWSGPRSPLAFRRKPVPWRAPERVAGVSAFGFGGTNFHAVVGPAPGAAPGACARDAWPAELFLFRGATPAEAKKRVERLAGLVAASHTWRLRDLARTVSAGGEGPVQLALVASDLEDLATKLPKAASFTADPRGIFVAPAQGLEAGSKLAFLFPGQGSQRPGMLSDLFVAFPALRRHLEAGAPFVDTLFPPDAFTPEAQAAQMAALTDTRVAQPTLGMVDLAMAETLARAGLRPDMLAGHSYGELAALAFAGALDEVELPALSAARGACILAAAGDDPGTMAAVTAPREAVEAILAGLEGVVLANHNAPEQCVISGTTAAVAEAVARLGAAGRKARAIPVACAFHSAVVAGARDTFAARLAEAKVAAPQVQVWSNTTAAPHGDDPEALRALLADHLARPVRFVEQIEAMYAAGARVFVEAGPGRVLCGLVDRILEGRPHLCVATDAPGKHGLTQLQSALAELAVAGVAVDGEALHEGRDSLRYDLDTAPSRALSPSTWLVNGHLARPLTGPLPPGALQPMGAPIGNTIALGAPKGGDRDTVVLEYLQTMKGLVDSQREIMLSYLGTPAPRVVEAAPLAEAADESAPAAPAPAKDVSLTDLLLGVVSERTGYPLEMLGVDLDLEADLSIDSIKRIEILGALGQHLGLDDGDEAERDALIEQLAKVKTIRGIVEWLEARVRPDASAVEATAAPAHEEEPEALPVPATVQRFVLRLDEAPLVDEARVALNGQSVAVTADARGVAEALVARLRERGTKAALLGAAEPLGAHDVLVDLSALDCEGEPAKALFPRVLQVAESGASRILALSALGGRLGQGEGPACARGGLAGLLHSVRKERPALRTRVVDVHPDESPAGIAELLLAELESDDDFGEVGYFEGRRRRRRVEALPVAAGGALTLDGASVVLVTGGARGITARIAVALAERTGCRLELVGRSPLPEAEEAPDTAAAPDAPALRALLARRGDVGGPREIEAAVARLLAAREIRGTLAAIRAAGAELRYHAVDVRDEAAFGALIDEIYARHGRLDGVVHGAGVLEDRLLDQKSVESFARVYDTKVVGARVLADKLREGLDFLVFFGSVAGVFGNRGQVDYAAANDALDRLALSLNGRLGRRVFSVDWGPWAGTGMVGPELEREYARRGIGLIPLEQGVAAFLDELQHGPDDEAQVIWMRAQPESLDG